MSLSNDLINDDIYLVTLLELTLTDDQVFRFCDDVKELTHLTNVYQPASFVYSFSQKSQGFGGGSLNFPNVEVENTNLPSLGHRILSDVNLFIPARARRVTVVNTNLDTIVEDITMRVRSLTVGVDNISFDLQPKGILNDSLFKKTYTRTRIPGIF